LPNAPAACFKSIFLSKGKAKAAGATKYSPQVPDTFP